MYVENEIIYKRKTQPKVYSFESHYFFTSNLWCILSLNGKTNGKGKIRERMYQSQLRAMPPYLIVNYSRTNNTYISICTVPYAFKKGTILIAMLGYKFLNVAICHVRYIFWFGSLASNFHADLQCFVNF